MPKENVNLYCAFIDALWFKLTDNGVSSKLTRMLRSLYHKVLAAVKMQSDVFSVFEIALAVKQGELLSPLSFILLFMTFTHTCMS